MATAEDRQRIPWHARAYFTDFFGRPRLAAALLEAIRFPLALPNTDGWHRRSLLTLRLCGVRVRSRVNNTQGASASAAQSCRRPEVSEPLPGLAFPFYRTCVGIR